jgi:hypothetical protein
MIQANHKLINILDCIIDASLDCQEKMFTQIGGGLADEVVVESINRILELFTGI